MRIQNTQHSDGGRGFLVFLVGQCQIFGYCYPNPNQPNINNKTMKITIEPCNPEERMQPFQITFPSPEEGSNIVKGFSALAASTPGASMPESITPSSAPETTASKAASSFAAPSVKADSK